MNRFTLTTPIVNYAFNVWDAKTTQQFQIEQFKMHDFHHAQNLSPIDWMKKVFGRQNYVCLLGRRYYVWEQSEWRLYAHNTGGLSFEVNQKLNGSQSLDQWNRFFNQLK